MLAPIGMLAACGDAPARGGSIDDLPTLPVERALAGEDGSVWIAFRPVLADSVTWILLRPDGEPRGRLELPQRVRILWHSGEVVYASVPDELDVPWLVRYRLSER